MSWAAEWRNRPVQAKFAWQSLSPPGNCVSQCQRMIWRARPLIAAKPLHVRGPVSESGQVTTDYVVLGGHVQAPKQSGATRTDRTAADAATSADSDRSRGIWIRRANMIASGRKSSWLCR